MNAPSIASKATVSRADLLRILATQGEWALERTAFALGYERKLPESAIAPQEEAVPRFSAQPPQEIKPERIERPSSLPAARFFYVTQRERHGQTAEQKLLEAPEWFEKAKALAHDERPEPGTVRFPAHLPLTRWARLWPFLRSMLGQSYLSRQPDIPRLISKLSNGETVRKLPLRAQHYWSARICILLDYNRQTLPFREDFNALCQALKRLRGAVGLEIRILHDEPGIRTYYRQPRDDTVRRWQVPDVQTPLLILSDLGMLAGAPEYLQAWQQLGCRLRAAGCKPIVLCPVPAQYYDTSSQRLFSLHEWDRQSHFQRSAIRQSSTENAAVKGAEMLLTLLAPAIIVEPALLRAVRYLLPAAQADVAAEAVVWSHPDVIATTQGFCFGSLAAIEKYQRKFMALDPELKCRLVGLIRSHHAHLPKSLRLAELDVCERLAPDCLGDPVCKEVKQWKQDMVKTCYQYPNRPVLSQWLGRHVARHSQTMWQDNPELAALWALAQRDKLQNGETLELPRHAREEDVLFFLQRRNNFQPRPCILRQRGQELVLEEHNATGNQTTDLHNPGSHLANLTLATDGLFVQQEYTDDPQPAPLHYVQLAQFPQVVAELTQDTQRIRLQTTSEAITIGNCTKPAWASSIGCDQYGLFADLTVKNVTQRFRRIVPGIFLMGSPEDEPERYNDETQHQVTLTQGYWLADSACTQALWQAVMGNNPSYSQDDEQNPVEQVSWNDVQGFVARLNSLAPGLEARLPTEAQWEYACRAGKTTPFSFGENITPEQVNYNGEYPYAGGKKGLGRGKTVPVKSLPSNPWGLYEMHGNVWEWCADWFGDYPAESVVDPDGSPSGADRVLRGGSWFSHGRYARSAHRYRREPDNRRYFIGFRLSHNFSISPGKYWRIRKCDSLFFNMLRFGLYEVAPPY